MSASVDSDYYEPDALRLNTEMTTASRDSSGTGGARCPADHRPGARVH